MTGVSTLSQLTSQLQRFETLNAQFSDLQRALSSNKKTTSYQGLGDDALTSLRQRGSIKAGIQYTENITVATTRIKSTNNTLTLLKSQTEVIRTGIRLQPIKGETDLSLVQASTTKLLGVVSGVLNEDLDGRFLLAGSDATVKPYDGNAELAAKVDGDLEKWLEGSITTATLLSRIDAYTDDEVGFSPEVLASGNVTVTADDDLKIDYTAKASDISIKKILVAVEVINQLKLPTATQAPTNEEFHTVYAALSKKLDEGTKGLEATITSIAASNVALNDVQKRHAFDNEVAQSLVDDIENTDVTDTAVKLSNVQLQLEASYRVTAAASSLNLLNFL